MSVSITTALIMCMGHLIFGVNSESESLPLTKPYRPHTEVILALNSQSQAIVLLPQDARYAEVARKFVARFHERIGIELSTLSEAEFLISGSEARSVVVFGNFATGSLSLRLYANKLICSDGLHPGAAGYELRTVPDALDIGADILFFGGSEPEGVEKAIGSFFAELKPGNTVSVPHSVIWKDMTQSAPGPISQEEINAQVKAANSDLTAFRSEPFRTVCGRLILAARNYYLSGDDSWGRLYARLVELVAEHYAQHKPDPPTFILADLVMALDQVEESSGLADTDRLRAAEWLRQMVEDTMDFWEMSDPIARYKNNELRPIWNHETYPALGIAHAAQYLRTHYTVPAAKYWEAVVDNLFAGQVQCDQPLEDSANYQWSVPRHTISYVLATGRLHEYFTDGALEKGLEYAIASHDNQGNEATHGDAWQPFGSTAGSLFSLAIPYYKDARYRWMLGRIGINRAPGLWQFADSMEAQEPDDHIGLRIFTVHPARVDAYGIQGIDPERVLDKAVLRSGWKRTDEYLMLDGLNVGNHKHLDANAIIRFAANRRLWLVDMDYIRAAPKYHNSIAVVRDGQAPDQSPASNRDAQVIAEPPFAAELLHAAGSHDRAVIQSLLSDYGGLDWQRSIFWKARSDIESPAGGGFLVVIDELQARSEADYIARCFWRTLGQVRLEGNRFQVTQRGEHRSGNDFLRIMSDGERTVVQFLKPQAQISFSQDLNPGKYSVDLIAMGTNGSADSLWLQMDEGEQLAYHLSIGDYAESSGTHEKDTPGPAITVQRGGEHRFRISLRESPGVKLDKVVFTPQEGKPLILESEDLVKDQIEVIDEPEQHFFIVNADGARPKLTESFDYGHGGDKGYYARYAFADKMTKILIQTKQGSLQKGEAFTFANLLYTRSGTDSPVCHLRPINKQAWIVDGDIPALVGIGPQEFEGFRIHAGLFLLTADGLTAADAQQISLLGTEWQVEQPVPLDVQFGAEAASPVSLAKISVAKVRDLLNELLRKSSSAPDPTAFVETAPGAIIKPSWQRDLKSRIIALAADEPGVLCGLEDGQVVLFDSAGKIVWRQNAGSTVRCAAFARFDPDHWACLVGTSTGDVKALNAAAGQELWIYRCQSFHGRSGSVGTIFAADLDGDGYHEVVAGSDNWHYHGISSDGKLLWRTETVHAGTVGCAADLTGDGLDDVVAGTEYYWPRLLDSTGKIISRMSGGPVTTAVNAFDLDGDGKAEALIGMDDAFVRFVKPGQRAVRKVNVGGSPTAIEPLDVDGHGNPGIVCSSESFSVYAFGPEGSQIWRTQLPDVVNDLAIVGERIAAACDDGRVYVLNHQGKVTGTCHVQSRPTSLARSCKEMVVAAVGHSLVALSVDGAE